MKGLFGVSFSGRICESIPSSENPRALTSRSLFLFFRLGRQASKLSFGEAFH